MHHLEVKIQSNPNLYEAIVNWPRIWFGVRLLKAWNKWSFGPLKRREILDQLRNCMVFSRKTFQYEIS
jgi:hypothetical protein